MPGLQLKVQSIKVSGREDKLNSFKIRKIFYSVKLFCPFCEVTRRLLCRLKNTSKIPSWNLC